jgi:hypothetical protein
MKKAPARSAGPLTKNRTKSKIGGGKIPPLEVKSGHLVVNGEHKFPIGSGGEVSLPSKQVDGIMVELIPEDIRLSFDVARTSGYPMTTFQSVEISRYEKEGVIVGLHVESPRELWRDPLTVKEWKAIMDAAVSLEFNGDPDVRISGSWEDSDLFYTARIPFGATTIGSVVTEACIRAHTIERRARAFHFLVAQEVSVFDAE